MVLKRRQFPSVDIFFLLILRVAATFSTVEPREVILRHSTCTNSYDGSLPSPVSFNRSLRGTAATVPQRHVVLHFEPIMVSFRDSRFYQSLRRQPTPPRHLPAAVPTYDVTWLCECLRKMTCLRKMARVLGTGVPNYDVRNSLPKMSHEVRCRREDWQLGVGA
jgi:hypothetical protein